MKKPPIIPTIDELMKRIEVLEAIAKQHFNLAYFQELVEKEKKKNG